MDYHYSPTTFQADWRYWPNIGCYEFSFQRTVFFDLTGNPTQLACDGCRGSELRRFYTLITFLIILILLL